MSVFHKCSLYCVLSDKTVIWETRKMQKRLQCSRNYGALFHCLSCIFSTCLKQFSCTRKWKQFFMKVNAQWFEIQWMKAMHGFPIKSIWRLKKKTKQNRKKESTCQCRRLWFHPWVRKIPCRRKRQPIPEFLPGKSYEHRSVAGCSPCGPKKE